MSRNMIQNHKITNVITMIFKFQQFRNEIKDWYVFSQALLIVNDDGYPLYLTVIYVPGVVFVILILYTQLYAKADIDPRNIFWHDTLKGNSYSFKTYFPSECKSEM